MPRWTGSNWIKCPPRKDREILGSKNITLTEVIFFAIKFFKIFKMLIASYLTINIIHDIFNLVSVFRLRWKFDSMRYAIWTDKNLNLHTYTHTHTHTHTLIIKQSRSNLDRHWLFFCLIVQFFISIQYKRYLLRTKYVLMYSLRIINYQWN